MNPTLPRMNQVQLKKMIELQAKETAREQALGIATQIVSSAFRGLGHQDPLEVSGALFKIADALKARLESELVAAKAAEVVASTEVSETVA